MHGWVDVDSHCFALVICVFCRLCTSAYIKVNALMHNNLQIGLFFDELSGKAARVAAREA